MTMTSDSEVYTTTSDVIISTESLFSTNTTSIFPQSNITKNGGCIKIAFGDYIPWNNTHNIVSAETEIMVERIKSVYVIPILCLIGIPSNVINMAVFARQGLKERIHLCLFALSFADLVFLAQAIVLVGERLRSPDDRFGSVVTFVVNHHLLGPYGFVWASQFMSAVIASERCFCILFPLRSKTLLTSKTMAIIIVIAFIVIVGGFVVVSFRFSVVCVYNEEFSVFRKMIWNSEFYDNHKEVVEWLEYFFYGGLSGLCVLTVTICTIVTAIKLKQIVTWRASTSLNRSSFREIALTRMLIGTSVLFVVCFLPSFLFRAASLTDKKFNTGRTFNNLYQLVLLSCLDMANCVNASFNFIFYYRLGTRYRQVLWEIVCVRGHCKKGARNSRNSVPDRSGSNQNEVRE